MVKAEETCLEA